MCEIFFGGGLPLELLLWLHRLAAMILASHARNRGSIPLGGAIFLRGANCNKDAEDDNVIPKVCLSLNTLRRKE